MTEQPVIILPWQAKIALSLLVVLLLLMGVGYSSVFISGNQPAWFNTAMFSLWLAATLNGFFLLFRLWREYSRFGSDLYSWAEQFRQGNLSRRLPTSGDICPSYLIRERLNTVADDYQELSGKLEQRLQRQERLIQQKKFYLSVLYDVASHINRARNLDDLLKRFLDTMQNVHKAQAVTVRLLDKEGKMRLVASVGLSDNVAELDEIAPSLECICAKVLQGEVGRVNEVNTLNKVNIAECNQRIGDKFLLRDDIEVIAIPLQYRDKTLGVYNVFISTRRSAKIEEEYELLMSIGRHMGMAIEKAGLDEEARVLSIMDERTHMAHELHDSLAQTLASLRFKVRLMDDTLNKGDEQVIWSELEGLEKSIDDANAELRSLITHFRAPIDGKGIVRSIERMVERFGDETNIDTFFYHNWHSRCLDRDVKLEAIRIVQEALANVRKHSQAETVRILMYSSEEGVCRILVEDDGIGLPDEPVGPDFKTGEHFGLTTMRERAKRIGGEVTFESEPDEGTLVQLNFSVDWD